ncbi:MAG: hypothetical protein ACXWCQ_30830 [Burkholderiales bacterium]
MSITKADLVALNQALSAEILALRAENQALRAGTERTECRERCEQCHGSGTFGRKGGVHERCYGCLGKGYKTLEDKARSDQYWSLRKAKEAPHSTAA